MSAGDFAAIAITLYSAHHVGDYWVQRDEDAKHKGDAGELGRLHCLHHVLTYIATQTAFLIALTLVTKIDTAWYGVLAGLAVSGVTHYIADRRTPLAWIASKIPGKSEFLNLGKPRPLVTMAFPVEDLDSSADDHALDNFQLATGAWALDQSWHIFWGVFVAALIVTGLS